MRLSILLERLFLQLVGIILFHFRQFISKTILLLPHFMLCLYTIVPFFMAIFLSEKRTIRQNIYFEGVVNNNVRDLF